MRGTGHRIFVDAGRRGEEAGDEIEAALCRAGSDHHAARSDRAQPLHVGTQCTHRGLGIELGQIIEAVPAEIQRLRAQRLDQARRWRGGLLGNGGKIELYPRVAPAGREHA